MLPKSFFFYFLFFLVSCGALFLFWQRVGKPQVIPEPPISANHTLQCVSYTPFLATQTPYDFDKGLKLSNEQFDADLAILSRRFSCIRTYSVTGMEELPIYVKKYGMKMMLGIWVNGDEKATNQEIAKAISIVEIYRPVIQSVIVGNETLLRREAKSLRLIHYLHAVKEALPDIPITYADVWEFWLENPEVAVFADFVTIHILPYWENEPSAIGDAVEHVQKIHDKLADFFPNKPILIGETGWPSSGRMREGALPSSVNQARFIRGVVHLMEQKGWDYNLIEAFDQPWKRSNEGEVGGNWGLFDPNRRDKGVFEGEVSNDPKWKIHFWWSLGMFLIFSFVVFSLRRKNGVFPSRLFRLATAFGLIVVTLELILDGRYRSFPLIAFFLPVMASLCVAKENLKEEKILGGLLALGGILVLIIETPLNWQADLWAGFCSLLSFSFLKGGGHRVVWQSIRPLFWPLAVALTSSLIIRYGLMEWGRVTDICLQNQSPGWCSLRSIFGYLFYLQFFGRLGFVFLLLSFIFPQRFFILGALILSLFGLVLYNVTLSAPLLLLALMRNVGFCREFLSKNEI